MAQTRCLSFALLGFKDHWHFTPADGGDVEVVAVRPHMVATNALLLRESALSGIGPALLSDWMIGDDLAAGALVEHVLLKVRTFTEFMRTARGSAAGFPMP